MSWDNTLTWADYQSMIIVYEIHDYHLCKRPNMFGTIIIPNV